MYKNAGKSLKRYVSTLMTLMNISVIAIAFLMAILLNLALPDASWLVVLIVLAFTAIGLFLVRILGVGFYAFGEIADQALQIRKILEGKTPDAEDDEPVPVHVAGKNEWKCTTCGFINDVANDGCIKCGKRRI